MLNEDEMLNKNGPFSIPHSLYSYSNCIILLTTQSGDILSTLRVPTICLGDSMTAKGSLKGVLVN